MIVCSDAAITNMTYCNTIYKTIAEALGAQCECEGNGGAKVRGEEF